MSGAYYLNLTCRNCDEDIYYGVCVTLIEHKGLPVISVNTAECESFECDNCGATNYTGELEIFSEGGLSEEELAVKNGEVEEEPEEKEN